MIIHMTMTPPQFSATHNIAASNNIYSRLWQTGCHITAIGVDRSQGGPGATASSSCGGQGVHRELESEGHEEKYRAVIEGANPQMNRSAKGRARSSLDYSGEGVL